MGILRHGGVQELRHLELEKPEPGVGEVRVRVVCSAMNPADIRAREPSPARRIPRSFPLVTGYDVAGEVDAIGPGVSDLQIGDPVHGSPDLLRQGAHAEYVIVDHRRLRKIPSGWSWEMAAALPLAGVTALECLERARQTVAAERVLIHAGAGGVGHLQIQLARAMGLEVWTTAGRDESVALCSQLGARRVIDYRHASFVAACREALPPLRIIFDNVGGACFEDSLEAIGPMGVLVSIVPTPSQQIAERLFLKAATVTHHVMGAATFTGIDPDAQGLALQRLVTLAESRAVAPHVSAVYRVRDLARAHEHLERGRTLGKVVIRVADGW
ncbi:quinone oxidoreductase family protein [Spiribacter halobius]|nr:NADP-dependent oxidoreductase [Spiribacter halobius]UEX78198.1 NADP-dependent oxidoreductase [Spiribacter halobius]